jgi:hypothetical protein
VPYRDPEKRRAAKRESARRRRERERKAREATRAPSPELPSDLVGWCRELIVTEGEGVGERLRLLPWELEFLRRVEGTAAAFLVHDR